MSTHSVPRIGPDSTLPLLLEGYEFARSRARRLGGDLFETRLAGLPITCMTGPGAAEAFYDAGHVSRRRAVPRPTLTLLQDFGSVQGLQGAPHEHRKAMFLELMTRERLDDLRRIARREWREAARRWSATGEAVVDDEAALVLCRAVCAWSGVPLDEREELSRARDLRALYDGAGSVGPRNVRGQLARRRCERWATDVVRRVRRGEIDPPDDSAAAVISRHADLAGVPLPEGTAAVELLNVLRPTVAVGRFVTFAALALAEHPEWRERVAGDEGPAHRFVQEVRRTAPFFTAITGRVETPFTFGGRSFSPGDWLMLDIYGTNRDPRSWEDPDRFDPDRFEGREPTPYDLIPQGAGVFETGHRCAGEWATIALLEVAVTTIARLDWRLGEQNLTVDLRRMPAKPRSGVVLHDVGPGTALDEEIAAREGARSS